MEYRCAATSLEGFVSRFVNLITHGYYFYAVGEVPMEREAEAIDQKIIERYLLSDSVGEKARRRRAGQAGVHYLRLEGFYVVLATHGRGAFFERERWKDIREEPLVLRGYSISLKPDTLEKRSGRIKLRGSVRIYRDEYLRLKAQAAELAAYKSGQEMQKFLWQAPWEPYSPVRQQMLNVLREVNRIRKRGGLDEVPWQAIRMRRKLVGAFA